MSLVGRVFRFLREKHHAADWSRTIAATTVFNMVRCGESLHRTLMSTFGAVQCSSRTYYPWNEEEDG